MDYTISRYGEYLEHHGTKGQKWGVRRYQNEDGSLTPEGKERYGEQRGWEARQMYKRGTITKQEMKDRVRSNGMGFADFVVTGNTRRMREFQRRHEKGFKAYSTAMGALAGVAMGSLAGIQNGRLNLGAAAVGAILGGAAGGVGGYAGQAFNNKVNRAVIEKGYNSNIRG